MLVCTYSLEGGGGVDMSVGGTSLLVISFTRAQDPREIITAS
jgi:hypothetical protein